MLKQQFHHLEFSLSCCHHHGICALHPRSVLSYRCSYIDKDQLSNRGQFTLMLFVKVFVWICAVQEAEFRSRRLWPRWKD